MKRFASYILFISFNLALVLNKSNADFAFDLCRPVSKYQKVFNGKCDLGSESSFANLISENVAFIQKSDPKTLRLPLDNYFKNVFFNGSASFFTNNYPEYSTELKKYQDELDSTTDMMADSISAITVEYFLTAYKRSQFDQVIDAIKTKVDTQYNQLIEEEKYDEAFALFCSSGGFCSNVEEFFELEDTNSFRDLNLDEFLSQITQVSYDKLVNKNNEKVLAESKKLIDDFIEELNSKGLSKVIVARLSQVAGSELISEIIRYFDPTRTTIKTTTIRTTTPTTTKSGKVDQSLRAVSNVVIATVPTAVMLLGVIVTISIIYWQYDFRPIISHHVNANEKAKNQNFNNQEINVNTIEKAEFEMKQRY